MDDIIVMKSKKKLKNSNESLLKIDYKIKTTEDWL